MRLYESLSYLNNNNNINNNNNNHNDNIDRVGCNNDNDNGGGVGRYSNGNSNGNTVKTFTSNGNQQSNIDSSTFTSTKTATTNLYLEFDNSPDRDALNAQRNWQLETEFTKALSALNETYCFYGSHRKLKLREHPNAEDDNTNGNGICNGDVNSIQPKSTDKIDLIDEPSSDIEAEINRLINRSNLCRHNFECESYRSAAPNEELMDEEEEFSSLSISASLSAEKPPYPRGIINPNYPGFQHLAHTLSEHFVDHHGNQTGSMSDSDFSEVDSDFPSEGHNTENNNQLACDDSNGNNIIEEKITTKNVNLSTVEEILRTVFESNSNHLTAAIEMLAEKEVIDDQTDLDSIDCPSDVDACDLKTYLEYYDDSGINISNVKCFVTKIATPPNEPDVIQKSNSCERGFDQGVDKPDILLDVAENVAVLSVEKEEPGSAWSITPVDIVGNFEQEVEREFGLLVTGYRSNSFSSDCDEVDGVAHSQIESNENFMTKISDAVLSNAKDTLSKVESLVSQDGKQFNDNVKNQIPTAIVKPKKYQRSSFDDRQLPTVAYMNDEQTAWYDKQNNTNEAIKCSASAIAAVATHPKKIHLPDFDRKAKKHMKSTNSATSAHNASETAHNNQNNTTDNTKTPSDGKATVHRADTNCSIVQKLKKSSASVAVVQPRKKERMDERTLMETIVQMQIKKNAQLYRGQGNNNKPNGVITANTPSPINPASGNAKYLNNNNNINNNNNNGDHYTPNSEPNQAKKDQKENSGCFDVYNIETALPVIDLETIENHLKLVKEDERRKRNDREEIRRRLAMGAEDDYLTKISTAKPGRKPSLQTRLQEGKNLQICFVNDAAAAADVDSTSSESDTCPKLTKLATQSTNSLVRHTNTTAPNPYNSRPLSMKKTGQTSQEKVQSSVLTLEALKTDEDPQEIDFFTKQARLQIEARMALAQAKDIAHMQMEMGRQKQIKSPITNMIRRTVEKVGYNFPAEKRRVSRQMLTDMNVAQLQIIVNEFHTQIESLNEQLVKYLMDRDDLHMSQDSMLVDIEDLTRYLGAKKDPYSERKKPVKKYHSMKSPKYLVSKKIQPQHRLASQIGNS